MPLHRFLFLGKTATALLLILTITLTQAQGVEKDSTETNQLRHVLLTINPIRPIVDESTLFLELGVGNRKAIELRGGIIYPNHLFGLFAAGLFHSPRYYYHGGLAGVGLKLYDHNEKLNYWGIHLTYRHKYFDDGIISIGGKNDYEYRLSQQMEVFNLQVLRGAVRINNWFLNEIYIGLGYSLVDVSTRYLECSICNEEDEGEIQEKDKPLFDNGIYHYPTFHLGYRFGVKLNKNN
jgi:hypothetical protein